ncbi:MAG: esterase superfamily [Puniceicoccaceae bacterium 5H]|nr:MAG: esterase superfamily [Puniceicoccaceae bacterium 5H]
MAFLQVNFYSEVLQMASSLNVILPERARGQIGLEGKAKSGPHPTLYLLHGLSDDQTIWMRRTSIERYVSPLGLAVIMPNVHRSFYTDMVAGPDYWTYVSEEVPAVAREFFNLSDRRKDNYVAGLSMGGYGAFKMGLRNPERWNAAVSLSGALDVTRTLEGQWKQEMALVFGHMDQLTGSKNDLFHLMSEAARKGIDLPRLWACCGTNDFLLDSNRQFMQRAKDLKIPVEYTETDGYYHEWGYWDKMIQPALKWMLAGRAEAADA